MKTFTASLLIVILFGSIATTTPLGDNSFPIPTTTTLSASPAPTTTPSIIHPVCLFACPSGTSQDENVDDCNCLEHHCLKDTEKPCTGSNIWAYSATSMGCDCILPCDACKLDIACHDNFAYGLSQSDNDNVCKCLPVAQGIN